MASKHIASLVDGRVCPWYLSDDPIPEKFVVIPDALWDKYLRGEIADGKELAKAALMKDGSEVGTTPQNVVRRRGKRNDAEEPSEVDPAAIPQGEPTQPNVTHFPSAATMRA